MVVQIVCTVIVLLIMMKRLYSVTTGLVDIFYFSAPHVYELLARTCSTCAEHSMAMYRL